MNSSSSAASLIDPSVSSAPPEGSRPRGRKRSRELDAEAAPQSEVVSSPEPETRSPVEPEIEAGQLLSSSAPPTVAPPSATEDVTAGESLSEEVVEVETASVAQEEVAVAEVFEAEAPELPDGPVNYDEPGLLEIEIDEDLYRLDAGKQGTALCLSVRPSGSWRWGYLGEIRWDGRDLRSRALSRQLLEKLSRALRQFIEETAN